MKIITSIVALALIIGVGVGLYIFVQDQKIKKDLENVDQAEFVEDNTQVAELAFNSEIKAIKTKGLWSIEDTEKFSVDADSLKFEFTGYKPGGLHTGTFETINSVIRLDENGTPVSASFLFDIASVKTDNPAVDTHLQTKDFFDAEVYPQINTEIKKIETQGSTLIAITDITMKGVTKTIAIPVQITQTGNETVFAVDTLIKISDFSIAYGPVQDEVRIALGGKIIKK